MVINDLYRLLFGRSGTSKGTDIDMAEHGRAGGISTEQGFKFAHLVEHSIKIDYDGNSNPIYVGIAAPGTATSEASWQIRKLTFDGGGNVTTIRFANGEANFISIWDDRTSLSYS